MNIQKKLSLNKHPGDCVPYSLVAAKNVKVSNDDRMIVNEAVSYTHLTLPTNSLV